MNPYTTYTISWKGKEKVFLVFQPSPFYIVLGFVAREFKPWQVWFNKRFAIGRRRWEIIIVEHNPWSKD